MLNDKRIVVEAVAITALLSACGQPGGDTYFPLDVGAHWSYELKTEMPNPPVDRTLQMSVDRQVRLDGKDVTVRRSASGVEYYLQQDASGIRRLATRIDLEEQPQLDEQPRTVLPGSPAVGMEWDVPTAPLLLMRNAEFPRELKHRHKTMMRYRIESVSETVEVPAGVFKDCLRVKGITTFKLFKDPIQGFADQPIIATEWYCKGVGLVQLDREEQANSSFLTGGKIRYQLVDYSL